MTSENPSTTEELEAQIEVQRDQLAQTVEQLGAKFDLRSRVREQLSRARTEHVVAVIGGLAVMIGAMVWWRRGS